MEVLFDERVDVIPFYLDAPRQRQHEQSSLAGNGKVEQDTSCPKQGCWLYHQIGRYAHQCLLEHGRIGDDATDQIPFPVLLIKA